MKKIMKRIFNFVEKLTLKQTKIITYSITIFIIIYLIAFYFIYPYNKSISYLSFCIVPLVPIAYYMSVQVEHKKFLIKEKMIRPQVRKEFGFASGEFVEVIPSTKCDSQIVKEWLTLGIEIGARFWTKEIKENGEDKILLVIKDENGEEIKGEPIKYTNYFAFYNTFNLKNKK